MRSDLGRLEHETFKKRVYRFIGFKLDNQIKKKLMS
jgi:hypothetical protein